MTHEFDVVSGHKEEIESVHVVRPVVACWHYADSHVYTLPQGLQFFFLLCLFVLQCIINNR